MRSKLVTIQPAVTLQGIAVGIKRNDAANYILSKTYARRLGDGLPRRGVLLALAGTMAAISYPLRNAAAVPLIPVVLGGFSLLAAAYHRYKPTTGQFEAQNPEDDQLKGAIMHTIYNDNDQVESSMMLPYSVPANTNALYKFYNGPAATTRGDKTFVLEAEDSKVDTEFQAV